MLATLTNTSAVAINTPEIGGTGRSADAVGGALKFPLPHPFGHIGPLAASASKVLPMHMEDLRHKSVPWLPEEPRVLWNQLIQAKIVTLALAQQTGVTDIEELAVAVIP